MRKKDEQRHRNRTCRFAIEIAGHYTLKTKSECPYAMPIMGTLQQGNFYAVLKEQCRTCEFYEQDLDKQSKFELQEDIRREIKNEKARKHTTKYIW